jgi:lipoprotein-anchoring transpeptidase ErfK/SrfK
MFIRSMLLVAALSAVAWGETVEVKDGATVRSLPDAKAHKRGALAPRARFEVLEKHGAGAGCKGEWLRIATAAWVCSEATRASVDPPGGPPAISDTPTTYLLAHDAEAYDSVDDAAAGENGRPMPGQSGLKVRNRVERDGRVFFKTSKGWFIGGETVKLAKPSPYQGIALDDKVTWPLALVGDLDHAKLYDAQGHEVHGRDARPLVRGQVLPALKPRVTLPGGIDAYSIADDLYLAARAVRLVEPAPRPTEVGAGERWIDVDLGQQLLIAYEGDRPIYATLVSTALNTPKGIHRVESKQPHPLLESTEKYSDADKYRYETPWVMGLGGRYAMHAAYWHSGFGRNHGQGCVNLSPKDAAYVWAFTEPSVPPGWTTINATDEDGARGTVVRIR